MEIVTPPGGTLRSTTCEGGKLGADGNKRFAASVGLSGVCINGA
jgi:hypothetical protein